MQRNWSKIGAYFLLAVAALLRIIGYFRQTSFFLDEANLARNIAEKSYFELFFPLTYQQYAPPFFAQLCKANADLFGYTELGLRLFPFAAGLLSLLVFYHLLRQFFEPKILLYPLLLFVFNVYFYRHGLELKQYSVDVLMTVSFLLVAYKNPLPTKKQIFLFTLLGSISIWFSMPSVFILAGVGLCFLINQWGEGRYSWAEIPKFLSDHFSLLLMISSWLVSFGVLFFINLQYGIQADSLQSYHGKFFLSFSDWEQSAALKIGLFRAIVGKTTLALAWAILCLYAGLYQLWKTKKRLLWLLVIPIASCFFASAIHYYSLIVRLGLFLFPIFILIMGFGIVFLIDKVRAWEGKKIQQGIALSVLVFLMIFSLIHRSALPYFTEEFMTANPRSVLEQMALERTKNAPIFISHFGQASFDFYTIHYENDLSIPSLSVDYANFDNQIGTWLVSQKQQGIKQVWVYDSHTFGVDKKRFEEEITLVGTIKKQISAKCADAYMVEF